MINETAVKHKGSILVLFRTRNIDKVHMWFLRVRMLKPAELLEQRLRRIVYFVSAEVLFPILVIHEIWFGESEM